MEEKEAVIQMIENVALALYQQDKAKGVDKIEYLITQLVELMKARGSDLNLVAINRVLVDITKALEMKDYVLLADILFYDLKKLLE
jgi:hypothetical protein